VSAGERAGEECDDGNFENADGCDFAVCDQPTIPELPSASHLCRLCVVGVTGCGNGVVDAGEACDDGNAINGDSCNPDCTLP
jgi:cysteine-rich repeat protein